MRTLFLGVAIGVLLFCACAPKPAPASPSEVEALPGAAPPAPSAAAPVEENTDTGLDEAAAPVQTAVDPAVAGSLESYVQPEGPGPVFEVISQKIHFIKDCYFDGLADDPDLWGVITVQFTVNKKGVVTEATAIKNELNKSVAKCVVQTIKKLKFPRLSYTKTYQYPFQFKPN